MSRRLPALCLTFVLASCLGSCSDDPKPFDEFDAELRAFLREHELSGATVVVVHRDLGIVHARGFGDMDVSRVSLLASSSKVLSVGVLMRLADQGLLDLDAPISDYLAPLYGEFKTDITTAQLLSNSAGMVGLIDDPIYGKYLCQYMYTYDLADCLEEIYTADDAADRVAPDTTYRYGGGQWQLAGGLAQVVSGKSWAELVAETYAPCHPTVLGYGNHYARALLSGGGVDAALGYPSFFDGDPEDLDPTTNPNVEGGAYTDVRSYGEILLMHLRGGTCDGGRVLSEASVAAMQEDRIGRIYGGTSVDPTLPGYGLGWFVSRDEPGVVADQGAFGALPWIDNENGYGVMVIVEATPGATAGLRERLSPIAIEALSELTAP